MTKKDALLLIKNNSCTHVMCKECIVGRSKYNYKVKGNIRECRQIVRLILIKRLIHGESFKHTVIKEEYNV